MVTFLPVWRNPSPSCLLAGPRASRSPKRVLDDLLEPNPESLTHLRLRRGAPPPWAPHAPRRALAHTDTPPPRERSAPSWRRPAERRGPTKAQARADFWLRQQPDIRSSLQAVQAPGAEPRVAPNSAGAAWSADGNFSPTPRRRPRWPRRALAFATTVAMVFRGTRSASRPLRPFLWSTFSARPTPAISCGREAAVSLNRSVGRHGPVPARLAQGLPVLPCRPRASRSPKRVLDGRLKPALDAAVLHDAPLPHRHPTAPRAKRPDLAQTGGAEGANQGPSST